jgi:hypothetical protein
MRAMRPMIIDSDAGTDPDDTIRVRMSLGADDGQIRTRVVELLGVAL